LEINFFGADDSGNFGIISDQTKFIPIKIIGIKIKSGVKGTEYAIQAVPFNHQANLESVQATKANFEVTATTIADYFANNSSTATNKSVDATYQQNLEDSARATSPRPVMNNDPRLVTNQTDNTTYSVDELGNVVEPGVRTPDQTSSTSSTPAAVKSQSFVAAYNAWNLKEKNAGNFKVADQIRIEIDPVILAKGNLVESKKAPAQNTTMTKSSADQANQNNSTKNSVTPSGSLDFNAQVFSINAGTNINDIINTVMMNTNYIKSQLTDSSTQSKDGTTPTIDPTTLAEQNGGKAVSWFKIIPQVKLDSYDKARNVWGKTITYYIKHHYYYNSKDPRANISNPPKPVKDYQYIYTGNNNDIIEFDMDFNTLYYTALQAQKGNTSSLNKSAQTDEDATNSKTQFQNSKTPVPTQSQALGGNQTTTTSGAYQKSDTTNAHNVMQSFYSNSAGDNLSLKLKIIGDPTFIKQDDILYNPGNTGWATDTIDLPQNSSINMETGQIFCNVTFKTPVDFNDDTGLYLDNNNKYKESYFSGYYQVLSVENEFRQGKFTQTLDLIRQPNQPRDFLVSGQKMSETSGQRTDNLLPKAANPSVSQTSIEDESQISPEDETNAFTVADNPDNNDDNANTLNVASAPIFDPYDQIPADNPGDLTQIAQSGPTLSIGDNSFTDGSTIV
jgi:hypothetical protein